MPDQPTTISVWFDTDPGPNEARDLAAVLRRAADARRTRIIVAAPNARYVHDGIQTCSQVSDLDTRRHTVIALALACGGPVDDEYDAATAVLDALHEHDLIES